MNLSKSLIPMQMLWCAIFPNSSAAAREEPTATLTKPSTMMFTTGGCLRVTDTGGLIADWLGGNGRASIQFVIGPSNPGLFDSATARNTEPYKGPGTYKDVLLKHNVGLSFGRSLATVVVNPDRRSGTLNSNDGSVVGTWDCGRRLLD